VKTERERAKKYRFTLISPTPCRLPQNGNFRARASLTQAKRCFPDPEFPAIITPFPL
jgi:hypothetical protein